MPTEDELIKERMRKLAEIRKLAIEPYPYRYEPKNKASQLSEKYAKLGPEEKTKDRAKVAGRIMVTMPSEKDAENPAIGKYVEKYLKGGKGVPVEHRMRILRLIENICLGTGAVCYLTESMHGAGSPQAQKIMIGRTAHIESMKAAAKRLCGISD